MRIIWTISSASTEYLSVLWLSSSCDGGYEHDGVNGILWVGAYAVRSRVASYGRALILNFAHWVSRDDLRRGVPLCPACGKSPRRIDSAYCGIACQRWASQSQHQPRSPTSTSGSRPSPTSSGNSNWCSVTSGPGTRTLGSDALPSALGGGT
jgi:hypothetical protein